MARIKLGILQVNHDKSKEIGDHFPDDSHRFRDLFDELDTRFSYRVYMTIGGELPSDIDEQDAYLITGSPLSVLDDTLTWRDDLFDFIRKCDAAKKPLIGACFGHQAIAMALGGQLGRRDGGYNVGIEQVTFSDTPEFMAPAPDSLAFYMFHEDEVVELPNGCHLIGSSHGCAIASFVKGYHIFAIQSHPEFHDAFMQALLAYTKTHMSSEIHNAALASLHTPTDGPVFAQWCDAFIHQAIRQRASSL